MQFNKLKNPPVQTKQLIFLASALLFFQLSSCQRQQRQQQTATGAAARSCHLRELDVCAAPLLPIAQSIATSEAELNKHCDLLREANTCLVQYSRTCMTPMQRELVTAANLTLGATLDELCTPIKNNNNNNEIENSTDTGAGGNRKFRSTFLRHAKCLATVHKAHHQKTCLREVLPSIEALVSPQSSSMASADRRLVLGCW